MEQRISVQYKPAYSILRPTALPTGQQQQQAIRQQLFSVRQQLPAAVLNVQQLLHRLPAVVSKAETSSNQLLASTQIKLVPQTSKDAAVVSSSVQLLQQLPQQKIEQQQLQQQQQQQQQQQNIQPKQLPQQNVQPKQLLNIQLKELNKPPQQLSIQLKQLNEPNKQLEDEPENLSTKLEVGSVNIDIVCGSNRAVMDLTRLKNGSKNTCVLFENQWITPNQFQHVSGRGTARDWKRSIKHSGTSLKALLTNKTLCFLQPCCKCFMCLDPSKQNKSIQSSLSPQDLTLRFMITDTNGSVATSSALVRNSTATLSLPTAALSLSTAASSSSSLSTAAFSKASLSTAASSSSSLFTAVPLSSTSLIPAAGSCSSLSAAALGCSSVTTVSYSYSILSTAPAACSLLSTAAVSLSNAAQSCSSLSTSSLGTVDAMLGLCAQGAVTLTSCAGTCNSSDDDEDDDDDVNDDDEANNNDKKLIIDDSVLSLNDDMQTLQSNRCDNENDENDNDKNKNDDDDDDLEKKQELMKALSLMSVNQIDSTPANNNHASNSYTSIEKQTVSDTRANTSNETNTDTANETLATPTRNYTDDARISSVSCEIEVIGSNLDRGRRKRRAVRDTRVTANDLPSYRVQLIDLSSQPTRTSTATISQSLGPAAQQLLVSSSANQGTTLGRRRERELSCIIDELRNYKRKLDLQITPNQLITQQQQQQQHQQQQQQQQGVDEVMRLVRGARLPDLIRSHCPSRTGCGAQTVPSSVSQSLLACTKSDEIKASTDISGCVSKAELAILSPQSVNSFQFLASNTVQGFPIQLPVAGNVSHAQLSPAVAASPYQLPSAVPASPYQLCSAVAAHHLSPAVAASPYQLCPTVAASPYPLPSAAVASPYQLPAAVAASPYQLSPAVAALPYQLHPLAAAHQLSPAIAALPYQQSPVIAAAHQHSPASYRSTLLSPFLPHPGSFEGNDWEFPVWSEHGALDLSRKGATDPTCAHGAKRFRLSESDDLYGNVALDLSMATGYHCNETELLDLIVTKDGNHSNSCQSDDESQSGRISIGASGDGCHVNTCVSPSDGCHGNTCVSPSDSCHRDTCVSPGDGCLGNT